MSDTDWKRLARQEPEFVDYCKTILWRTIADSNEGFMATMFAFYQSGITAEQASKIMLMQSKMRGNNYE